jgi:hypothetical protein
VSDEGNQVKVYDKKGNVLKSYINDDKGKPPFAMTKCIALSADQNTLYVTDWYNGLIALDKSSSIQWTFSDHDLLNAYGLCVLPGDLILVSGRTAGNIIQVNKYGKNVGTLVGPGDKLICPRAIAYHRKSSRLIVGHDTNEIYVYTLSPK